MNKANHQLYVCIYTKYDNNVIPEIPRIIVSYLLTYPEKIPYYFNSNIHVGMLLDMLAKKYSENKNLDMLKEIIEFVEVKQCIMT